VLTSSFDGLANGVPDRSSALTSIMAEQPSCASHGRSGEQWRLRLSKPSAVDEAVTRCYLAQVDDQCFLMEDDTDIFPAAWALRNHPRQCGCPPSFPSPPSAQCVDPKPLARFDSSPPIEMAVLPSTSTVLAPPEASNKPAKKARKSRSDDGRRGVIRTMQDCYKKVLRFVKSDIAGTIASSCSQTDCLVRCENSSVLSAWRGEEDSHSVECCRG
jgi:hypothetical protein